MCVRACAASHTECKMSYVEPGWIGMCDSPRVLPCVALMRGPGWSDIQSPKPAVTNSFATMPMSELFATPPTTLI